MTTDPSSCQSHAPDSPDQLRDISTRWSCVKDVDRFVLRYVDAMQALLGLIVRDSTAADDILQTFLIRVIENGFRSSVPTSGRFRDYLTRSLRNAAIDYYRKLSREKKRITATADAALAELESDLPSIELQWQQSWTRCLLDRTWDQLEHHQQSTPGCRYYDVLALATDSPDQSSADAAAVLSATGNEMSPVAYRQSLHRARKCFAKLLIEEVRQTLDAPTDEGLQQEICELGLSSYVDRYV